MFVFFMTTELKNKENIFMYLYLGAIAVLFSIYFNALFHLTLIITLALLTLGFYENYRKRKTKSAGLVFSAFLIMTLGHVALLFSENLPSLYIVGEFVLLVGFSALLLNQVRIKNESKS